MDNFYQQMERDPSYAIVLPISVALHRFERDNQDFAKPRILVKKYDTDGFTIGFDVNRVYRRVLGEKISSVMEDLNSNSVPRILEALEWLVDPVARSRLEFMALGDRAEGVLYESLKKFDPERSRQIDEMPPLIARQYDEMGIPIFYGLNPRVTSLLEGEDGSLSIGIHGLPISSEELMEADIDQFLKDLGLKT